ncbi:hypothetical protein R1flu_011210 [Riccia fluitans]|uniref:Uncharacterized protein n=1 Tax=Riccia fluitans TaxID=41844 RepID=A0ABD1Z859_9MARC
MRVTVDCSSVDPSLRFMRLAPSRPSIRFSVSVDFLAGSAEGIVWMGCMQNRARIDSVCCYPASSSWPSVTIILQKLLDPEIGELRRKLGNEVASGTIFRFEMDHKRGHGSLDHSNEQFTRVKRHKDYSYQQPTTCATHFPQNAVRSSRLQSEDGRETRSSKRVELASVEQLRAIAEKSAKTVNSLGPLNGAAEKSVEENAYETFLQILLAELSAEKIAAGPEWPLSLTDRRIQKHCHICSFDRRFRGWEALLIHAAKYQKDKTRQHRGYYRALRQALLQSTDEQLPLPDIHQGPSSPLPSKKRASTCRWASPVKLTNDGDEKAVEKEDTCISPQKKKSKDRAKGLTRNPHLGEVLAVYSTGRSHQKRKVVFIPASQFGPLEKRILKKASETTETESIDQNPNFNDIRDHCPECKIEKYADGDTLCSVPSCMTTTTPCTSNGSKAMQFGRPSSSKDHLAETEQEKLQSEELKLRKPLEEHRHIFDEEQFDDKVQNLVNKWKGRFKDSVMFNEHISSLKPGVDDKTFLPKMDPEKDEKFKSEVENLNSSCKNQVKRQISVLQDELQKDKLVWLQEVEAVREQFQSLADSVYAEQ